jgi:hypothetical protein
MLVDTLASSVVSMNRLPARAVKKKTAAGKPVAGRETRGSASTSVDKAP